MSVGPPPTVARRAMVCTSQPLATHAGLRILDRGGNAADAAIAAAAVLCVTEPMSTGVGGDAFAIVHRDGLIEGLDAAGPAPASVPPGEQAAARGPRSVTVPGAVAGWSALAERHGRLGLDTCLVDAIAIAEEGFAIGVHTARRWAEAEAAPPEFGAAPRRGDLVRVPELGSTLATIAELGADAVYTGTLAESICSATWLEESDLASFRPRWVEPLRLTYRGVEVLELPTPTQGVAALEGLGLLQHLGPGLVEAIAATRLALADARREVRDGADVAHLLDPAFIANRAAQAPMRVSEPGGGTVYLCVVDEDRMAVSFIQSLYGPFGSGISAPGTGVVLNNRAACFSIIGEVQPGRRPYHTTIPGMLMRDDRLLGPFGIIGDFIQAQAHIQFLSGLLDDGLDPQAALTRDRFRITDGAVLLEEGLWPRAAEVAALGLEPVLEQRLTPFGGGQAILLDGEALLGGSDPRKDGHAGGY